MAYQRFLVLIRCSLRVLALVFWSQVALSQPADSASTTESVPSLQFQLFGGYGVDYIADRTAPYSFRLGVDVAFSHGDSSGNTNRSYTDTYVSSGGSSSSTSESSKDPDLGSTSLQVSVSALSVYRVAEFLRSSLGVGIGGIVSYSLDWTSDAQKQTSPGSTYSTATSERTITTWGIGPMVLLGIRSLLTDHFCLTAELSFSVVHQWTTAKIQSSSEYSYFGPTPSYQSNNSSETTKLDGWVFQLSKVRIGVAFDL